jgi:membrane dipeptidase
MRLLIDAHLDLAWNALSWKRDLKLPLREINSRERGMTDRLGRGRATVSLPELRRGGVAICFATLMARVSHTQKPAVHGETLDYPSQDIAYAVAQGQLAYYRRLAEMGEVRVLTNQADLDEHWQQWEQANADVRESLPVGVVVAMEGCDPIVHPEQAQRWHADGLRFPALVHYGISSYAVGTGEEGPLTERGRRLLREFARHGFVLDTTHLSDTSFSEALDAFDGMVIASHQNCRALVPGQRQFSDDQIRRVVERDGVLGTAFDAWMLYPGWVRGATSEETTSRNVVHISAAADHIDHICQLAGNSRHAAIGSDLDGGFGTEQTPTGLDTVADLPEMEGILADRGYSGSDLDAIFHGNWLRVLRSCV